MSRHDDKAGEVGARLEALAPPILSRAGLDLCLTWPNGGPCFELTGIRTGRDGVRGELTVTYETRRLSWGVFPLASIGAREALRKKLVQCEPAVPWGDRLETAAWELNHAALEGEPLVALTGRAAVPAPALVPNFLYAGNPTLLYADGDTGKSLVAVALATAVHAGARLPCGLMPARAVPVAYLDWETDQATVDARMGLVAAGLGIDPPGLLYKRMTRPLVEEAAPLAAELAHHGVGFVVIDSKMFAVAAGEGGGFHEPIVAFYSAVRLLGPIACLVVNHITNADARSGAAARPFGGAFAHNSPRLIWEARRDQEVEDSTDIVFTCTKANNLPRKPPPFGLRFTPGEEAITIYPLDLAQAAPDATRSLSLPKRIDLALLPPPGHLSIPELADQLEAKEESVARVVRRQAAAGHLVCVVQAAGHGHPARWGRATR
jgi:AAA domain